jgi:hypothetical protein
MPGSAQVSCQNVALEERTGTGMRNVSGSSRGKVVALAAAYLHAFVLLLSLVLVPANPLFNSYESAQTLALTDASLDEAVEEATIEGGDQSFWCLSQQARVSLLDWERRRHRQEAPRGSSCGLSFHARGPPVNAI